MGTQHVIAVGLTQEPTDGRGATGRDHGTRGNPDRTRPSAPPGDAA